MTRRERKEARLERRLDGAACTMTECSTVTGKDLRKLREQAGLSQAELAELAGIHRVTVVRWETDKVDIRKLEEAGLRALLAKYKLKK